MLTNHQKQKKWCKERLNYSMEQWKMIIFSDESNFKIINRKNKRFVCHKNTEKYLKQHMQSRIQKGGGSAYGDAYQAQALVVIKYTKEY